MTDEQMIRGAITAAVVSGIAVYYDELNRLFLRLQYLVGYQCGRCYRKLSQLLRN